MRTESEVKSGVFVTGLIIWPIRKLPAACKTLLELCKLLRIGQIFDLYELSGD